MDELFFITALIGFTDSGFRERGVDAAALEFADDAFRPECFAFFAKTGIGFGNSGIIEIADRPEALEDFVDFLGSGGPAFEPGAKLACRKRPPREGFDSVIKEGFGRQEPLHGRRPSLRDALLLALSGDIDSWSFRNRSPASTTSIFSGGSDGTRRARCAFPLSAYRKVDGLQSNVPLSFPCN